MRLGRLLLAAAALTAAGCAGTGTTEVAATGDVCSNINALEVEARRAAFTLDHARAERALREALVLKRGTGAGCAGLNEAALLADLGLALSAQRKFRLADATFAEARSVGAGEAEGASLRIMTNEAQHALHRKDVAGARTEAREASAALDTGEAEPTTASDSLFEVSSDEYDRLLLRATSLYVEALAVNRGGDPGAAATAINRAAFAASAVPNSTPALASRVELERASLLVETGRAAEGAEVAAAAAEQLEGELGATPVTARARLVQAVALQSAGDTEQALTTYARAFDIYEENPVELNFETVWPYVALAIEAERSGVISRAERDAGVFRAAQLVRSATAAAGIAEAAALLEEGSGESAAAVREWRTARDRLDQLTTVAARRDLLPVQREELEISLAESARREAELRARRDAVAPQFAAAIQRPVTLAGVQGALAPGEVLVQVLSGTPRTVAVVVTPDGAEIHTSELPADTFDRIVTLVAARLQRDGAGRVGPFPVEQAHALFQLLFGPEAGSIAGADRLFVVAQGPMQKLPLEVLPVTSPVGAVSGADYTGVDWLAERTTIAYLPATRNLLDLRLGAGSSSAGRSFAGFGGYDPTADYTAGIESSRRGACAPEVRSIDQLGAIPGAAQEVETIGGLFEGEALVRTGAAFTEDDLYRLSDTGELDDYRVVHFAAHGLLWDNVECFEPMLTAASPSGENDGLLEASELRRLSLDAQLVVLSACDTVSPTADSSGENLSGLTASFLGVGARTVIASHWLVDDGVAAGLWPDFYARLRDAPTKPISTALAESQAVVRANPARSHPFFWAPFVVFGDGALGLGT